MDGVSRIPVYSGLLCNEKVALKERWPVFRDAIQLYFVFLVYLKSYLIRELLAFGGSCLIREGLLFMYFNLSREVINSCLHRLHVLTVMCVICVTLSMEYELCTTVYFVLQTSIHTCDNFYHMIKFFFFCVLWFPPPIKLTATICFFHQ